MRGDSFFMHKETKGMKFQLTFLKSWQIAFKKRPDEKGLRALEKLQNHAR